VDVRRIVLIRRSQEEKRPWQHHRIGRAIVIVAFLFPSLVLSLGLVLDFQATGSSTHDLKLALFVKERTHRAIKASLVHRVVPLAASTSTIPPAAATVVPAPVPPAPAPTTPVVDSSSAIAWAASPGVACIREHESGDNYATDTGNGYYGAYQDLLSTWESHGGTGLPSDAPPAVQDQINYEVWLSGGWGQWNTAGLCGL